MAKALQTITASASGTTDFALIDPTMVPFGVSVSVYLSAGATLTYTVEHTAGPISGPDDSSQTVVSNSFLVNKTASSDINYAYPVTGVRLNITSYTSGTATMYVRQIGGKP